MTNKARELLQKMASAYDVDHRNDFDSTFYIGFPDAVIRELDIGNYIVKQNDVTGTIKLTDYGYNEAKK
ncbi:MAG: hypothetical protein E7453_06200 [Ruminococcaceae bacterium]|nr:hypothetical protein [Oscillospiraceae bacterium]